MKVKVKVLLMMRKWDESLKLLMLLWILLVMMEMLLKYQPLEKVDNSKDRLTEDKKSQ